MRSETNLSKGPFRYRLGVWVFALLLGLLLYWLGSYGLDDISRMKPPALDAPELQAEVEALEATARELEEQSRELNEQLTFLRESTEGSQRTMNQLLDLRRQQINNAVPMSDEEALSFAENQRIFLENQKQYQEVVRQASDARTRLRENGLALDVAREKMWKHQEPVIARHRLMVATLQFVVVLPFVVFGGLVYLKTRSSRYVALVHAHNAAALALLLGLIHAHFPRAYYKYLFLALAIVAVVAALVYLIRQFASPSRNWLLQRYREGYRTGKCPACAYPIERGDYRWMRFPGKVQLSAQAGEPGDNAPYTCPSCGMVLFDACDSCGKIRHTLLPNCRHCGAEKDPAAQTS
jgi:hypothetical protein